MFLLQLCGEMDQRLEIGIHVADRYVVCHCHIVHRITVLMYDQKNYCKHY